MPRWLQIILHVVTTAAGAYLSFQTGTPIPAIIATGVSGTVGSIAQTYNTDGTPQTTPFVPPAVRTDSNKVKNNVATK
jgi:hypothetical protein